MEISVCSAVLCFFNYITSASLGLSVFTEFRPCKLPASLQMSHRRLYILPCMVNVLSFPLSPSQRGSGISDEFSSLTQTADESLHTIWFTASFKLTSISLLPPSLLLSFLSYALPFCLLFSLRLLNSNNEQSCEYVGFFLASVSKDWHLIYPHFSFLPRQYSFLSLLLYIVFAGGKTATGLEYFTSTLLFCPCLLKSRPP